MEKNDDKTNNEMNKTVFDFDAVIIAAGDYPKAKEPLSVLQNARYTVCCDGAADAHILRGHTPDMIVGDGDSLSKENREKHHALLHRVTEQENNDLTKTVRFLLGKGYKKIAILGATGKREDHTLGNISLLMEYARAGATVRMFTDHGVFIPCNGSTTHAARAGQQISLFRFNATGLKSTGLRYPVYDFDNWWQGTLNECMGNEFTIEATGDYLLFINY